jgi:hypothetical protein
MPIEARASEDGLAARKRGPRAAPRWLSEPRATFFAAAKSSPKGSSPVARRATCRGEFGRPFAAAASSSPPGNLVAPVAQRAAENSGDLFPLQQGLRRRELAFRAARNAPPKNSDDLRRRQHGSNLPQPACAPRKRRRGSGRAVVPPGTRSRPGGRNVVPPGTRSRPGGRNVVPPGTRCRPGGRNGVSPSTRCRPGGRNGVPPGTRCRPGGRNVVAPGTRSRPGGRKVVSPGTRSRPGGRKVVAPGTRSRPGGGRIRHRAPARARASLSDRDGHEPRHVGRPCPNRHPREGGGPVRKRRILTKT